MKPNVKQKQPVVQLAINNALTGGGGGGGGDGYTKAEADAKFETITNAQSTYLAIADADEVPEVTSDDNGKVLTATYSEGTSSYAWATPASGLAVETDGTNYWITVNGIRLYFSSSAPTGTIPDGSLGIGW